MSTIETDNATQANVSLGESKKHLRRNTWSNMVFIAFNAITSILMVPYLRHHLGVANYGMVGLAFSFVAYIQVMTVALTTITSRYVVFHSAKGEVDEARSYMSTQLVTSTWVAIALIPVIVLVSCFASRIAVIPPGQERDTSILFAFVMCGFVVSIFSSFYGTCLYVRQRFDLRNWMIIAQQIVRYSIWIVAFHVMVPSLWQVGLGVFAETVTLLIAVLIAFRVLTPKLAPSLREFDRKKFWELIQSGRWVTVEQVGTMLFMGVDPFVINRMLGPTAVGNYVAIVGVAMNLRAVSVIMSDMVAPIAIATYARDDMTALMRNSIRVVRIFSTGLALPIGIVCGLATPFVSRWLGPQYAGLSVLIWILVGHQFLSSGVQPLFSVTGAALKLTVPGVVTVVTGILKLAMAIVLVKYTNLGIIGVAISSLIGFMLKNTLFAPFYAARVLKQPCWRLYAALLPSIVVFVVTAALGSVLSYRFDLASYPKVFFSGLALFAVCGAATYLFAMNKEDRELVRRLAPWNKSKEQSNGEANA